MEAVCRWRVYGTLLVSTGDSGRGSRPRVSGFRNGDGAPWYDPNKESGGGYVGVVVLAMFLAATVNPTCVSLNGSCRRDLDPHGLNGRDKPGAEAVPLTEDGRMCGVHSAHVEWLVVFSVAVRNGSLECR